METKRYKPRFDKLFLWIVIPTAALMLAVFALTAVQRSVGGFIFIGATTLFVAYFFISPCFGFVELREETVFFKFGFFLKREVSYARIRGIERKHTVIADSILSLKNAMDHVNIKFNSFDLFSMSLKDEEDFISEIKKRSNIH